MHHCRIVPGSIAQCQRSIEAASDNLVQLIRGTTAAARRSIETQGDEGISEVRFHSKSSETIKRRDRTGKKTGEAGNCLRAAQRAVPNKPRVAESHCLLLPGFSKSHYDPRNCTGFTAARGPRGGGGFRATTANFPNRVSIIAFSSPRETRFPRFARAKHE